MFLKPRFDIAYIAHDSIVEGIGMSQILPIVTGISRMGWSVVLLSCEKTAVNDDVKRILEGASVTWRPLKFGRQGSIGGFGRLVRIIFRLPSAKIYHCRGDLAASAVALRTSRPLLWDVRGLWVDQRLVIGNISSKSLVITLTRALEKIAAKKALAVTTLAQALYPILLRRYPDLTRIHKVVPTCTDLDLFQFSDRLPEKFRLLLSGVFNDYYDLELTSKFIQELKFELEAEVIWCRGAEAVKTDLNVGEDRILTLRQREMPPVIADATFGIALCKQDIGDSLAGVMPTKIAEFLAVGRPVVVSRGMGDLDELLIQTNSGVVLADEGDIPGAIERLMELVRDPLTPTRCRALAESHFDIKKALSDYDSLYRTMMKSVE